ncbi:MAG: tetratricopeptide repeat protein [Dehalococcoidales bacterium]
MMEEAPQFGKRLRELRIQAQLTQRELAEKIGVDFSYLSKIENGVLPPPSEKVILELAEVLNADRDELIISAGRIPADIAEMLKNRKTLQLLRSERTQQNVMAKREEGVSLPTGATRPRRPLLKHKNFARVAIALVLVMAVGALLWFALPVTDTAVAANNQGFIYNNEGEHQKAIVAFTKAIELDPGFAVAYSNRGWAYIELEQYEQAIADCNKAIELDPNFAIAYSNRGWAYIELGQYEQAIADCNKAIELDPNLAIAYNNRGWAYIELGQYEQAIADYDKAVELDPSLQK